MKISKLKGNKDNYELDEISCFEKPFGIAMEGFGEKYSNLFYAVLKMVKSYVIETYDFNEDDIRAELDIILSIIDGIFNIEVGNSDVKVDVCDYITDKLENENIVLIPGDLSEVYFSKYYKKQSWPHLFLIKGYDMDNSLFFVIDSTQFYKENLNCYREFVIPCKIIEEAYKKYKLGYPGGIYYINAESKNVSNFLGIFIEMLKLFLNMKNGKSYRELRMVENLYNKFEDSKFVSNYTADIINLNKEKAVFFTELLNCLKELEYSENKIENLEKLLDEIVKEWKLHLNIVLFNVAKKKKVDIDKAFSNVILKEKLLFQNVNIIVEDLINNYNDNKLSSSKYILENNEDNLISIDKENGIAFSLPKGKVYSSWFEDDSPKAIISNHNKKNNKFTIECAVKIIESSSFSKYHAGIFLRTSKNNIYCWGVHCGNIVRIDLSGISMDLFSYEYAENRYNLKTEVSASKCIVKLYDNEDTNIVTHEIELIDEIIEVGVCCKTWDESDHIKISFEDINYNVISLGENEMGVNNPDVYKMKDYRV